MPRGTFVACGVLYLTQSVAFEVPSPFAAPMGRTAQNRIRCQSGPMFVNGAAFCCLAGLSLSARVFCARPDLRDRSVVHFAAGGAGRQVPVQGGSGQTGLGDDLAHGRTLLTQHKGVFELRGVHH